MLDDYQDLIDELLGTPKLFRELLAGATGEVSPDVLALIADLRNRDRVVLDRLQRLTRETAPHLSVLPGPDDADIQTPEATTADDLIASFDSARGDLVSLLMNLTLKDWTRTATYDGPGQITLAVEVERHVEYDETRVDQVRSASR
jgi:hypothetical protein